MIAFANDDCPTCPREGTSSLAYCCRDPNRPRKAECTEYRYVHVPVDRAPDMSKLNRKDRRTMQAIARKHGWAL